jgi:hypothetical protein
VHPHREALPNQDPLSDALSEVIGRVIAEQQRQRRAEQAEEQSRCSSGSKGYLPRPKSEWPKRSRAGPLSIKVKSIAPLRLPRRGWVNNPAARSRRTGEKLQFSFRR